MEEDEDDSDLGALVGEAVGVALSVALDQRVGAQFAQVVSELVQVVPLCAEPEAGEDHLMELLRGPAADGGAGMQQHLHEADHAGVVNLDAGVLGGADGDGQGEALQQWEVDVCVQAARLRDFQARLPCGLIRAGKHHGDHTLATKLFARHRAAAPPLRRAPATIIHRNVERGRDHVNAVRPHRDRYLDEVVT